MSEITYTADNGSTEHFEDREAVEAAVETINEVVAPAEVAPVESQPVTTPDTEIPS